MACRARATSQAYPTAPRRATRFGRRSSPLPARAALLASLSAPKAASVRTAPHRIRPPALHPLQITCCRFLFPAIRILAAKTGVLSPKPAQNPGFAARKQNSALGCSQETKIFRAGMRGQARPGCGANLDAGKAGRGSATQQAPAQQDGVPDRRPNTPRAQPGAKPGT